MKKNTIKRMSFNAIFAALSLILYIVGPKFPLPFIFPSFLEINFSMLPILIATFMLGPVDGLVVLMCRFLIKLPFSSTQFVGEISDLISGMAVVLASGLMNKFLVDKVEGQEKQKHTLPVVHKNIWMCVVICVSWIIGGLLSNSFCLPMYCLLYTKDVVYGMVIMMSKVFTFINETNWILYYFLLAVIPFNLIISLVVGIVTILTNHSLKKFYDHLK